MNQQSLTEFDQVLERLQNLVHNLRQPETTAHTNSVVAPPPPPPQLPTHLPEIQHAPAKSSGGGIPSNLLNEINQGRDILKKLKPVNTTQTNHTQNEEHKTEQTSKPVQQAAKAVTKKEPVKKLVRDTWIIENYVGDKDILINEEEISMKSTIQIYDCTDSTITINGKIKAIMATNCKKVNIIFDKVVSNVECTKSQRLQILCRQSCPSMNIDTSTDVRICLDQERNTELYTCNSTEVNIAHRDEEGELAKDYSVPNQLITKWNDDKKKFSTEPNLMFF